MNLDRYFPPDLAYGFVPDFVNTGRSFRLRPGQLFTAVPTMADVPNQRYLDVGATNLLVSAGFDDQDADYAKLGCCLANDYLRNFLPNKPLAEWDESECIGAVDNLFDARGGGWGHTTGQMFEAYLEQLPWRVMNGSDKQRIIDGRIQQRLDAVGGVYCGEYNGSARINYSDMGPDYFRTALQQGGAAALQILKEFPAFEDGFYTQEAWRWRNGSINIYYVGEEDVHKFINERLVTLEMDRQAKRYLGTSRSTTVFAWSGKFQPTITPFSVQYAQPVTGGTLYTNSFPSWTSGAQIGMYFLTLADNCHFFSWEDGLRFGRSRSVITDEQSDSAHYEGNGVGRGQFATKYVTDRTVAFPPTPFGGQDLAFTAADAYSWAAQYAGWGSVWTPHRSGEGSFTDTAAGDHLTNCYVDHQGYSRLGGNGRYRWYFYMNTGLAAGQWETVEARVQPGILSFEAEGSTPHLFRFEL